MLTVTSPLAGRVVALDRVSDPVFAEAMVGAGIAVRPAAARAVAVAPLDGTLVSLHPHAFVVLADDGRGVLVHLGVDTVQLNGEGFEPLLHKGASVRRGDGVVRWDPGAVEASGRSSVCPVVALEAMVDALTGFPEGDGVVASGDRLFHWE